MTHCPNCETRVESLDDVAFADVESSVGFLRASKRFYEASCAACGETLGTGVAGASGDAAGGGGATT